MVAQLDVAAPETLVCTGAYCGNTIITTAHWRKQASRSYYGTGTSNYTSGGYDCSRLFGSASGRVYCWQRLCLRHATGGRWLRAGRSALPDGPAKALARRCTTPGKSPMPVVRVVWRATEAHTGVISRYTMRTTGSRAGLCNGLALRANTSR